MNRSELRDAVRSRTGYQASDGLITDAAINSALNAALHHLETIADWSYLQATEDLVTVAGTETVTPGGARRRTKSLTVVNGDYRYDLDEIPVNQLDDQWGDNSPPAFWCDWGDTIVLRPVPDAVYTVRHRFIRTDSDLLADDDSPLAPLEFQWALVEYVAYLLFRRDGDEKRAASAQDAFVQWMGSLKDNRRRGGAPVVPQIRPWD